MNRTSLKTLALASLIALTTSGAFAGFTTGDQLAISDADIRSRLEADGYTVLSIEREGDEIEVEAQSADGVVEFEISASTGIILETETDDDSEGEEDADEGNEDTDAAEDDDKDDA